MHEQGESIEVKTKETTFIGTYVSEDSNALVLKLGSGYNIGISRSNILGIKKISGPPAHKQAAKTKSHSSHLPTISLLHTGGTIASRVDYTTGAVVAKFSPEDILEMFPELTKIANIQSRLISNMMSENIRFHHYNEMAKEVAQAAKTSKGVILTHGTDTLHYSAAALSFALENIRVPVVLIGSQRSSDRPSSDGAANLLAASIFITQTKSCGVFVCMHEGHDDSSCIVIDGVSSRKMHTSSRDAFKPVNSEIVARIDVEKRKCTECKTRVSSGDFEFKPFKEDLKVALVKIHPHMHAEELAFEGFDGVVIEGTGLGHAQIVAVDEKSQENNKIKANIEQLAKKMPVAMTSQAIYGRVNMNVYSPGRELLSMGLWGNYCDMTPETAFIKLAWLLSNHRKDAKELYHANLRGEISQRSTQL